MSSGEALSSGIPGGAHAIRDLCSRAALRAYISGVKSAMNRHEIAGLGKDMQQIVVSSQYLTHSDGPSETANLSEDTACTGQT